MLETSRIRARAGSRPIRNGLLDIRVRVKLKQYRRLLAICWDFIGEDKRLFAAFVTISVIAALTEAFGVGLFIPLLDTVSQKSSFSDIPVLARLSKAFAGVSPDNRIPLIAAIMFIVVLVRGGLQYLIQFLNYYVPARIEQRLRYEAFDCLVHMDLRVVNASTSGGIQNFVSGYPVRIGQLMVSLGNLISNLAMLTIYAGLMTLMSVNLTLLSLLFMAVVFQLQRRLSSGELRHSGADVTWSEKKLGQVVYETLGGLSMIRSCGGGPGT